MHEEGHHSCHRRRRNLLYVGCGGYAALGSTSAFSVFFIDTFANGHQHWLYVIEIELFVLHMIIIFQVRRSLYA